MGNGCGCRHTCERRKTNAAKWTDFVAGKVFKMEDSQTDGCTDSLIKYKTVNHLVQIRARSRY